MRKEIEMKVGIKSFDMNDQKKVDEMKVFIEDIGKDNLITVSACANRNDHVGHVFFWKTGK